MATVLSEMTSPATAPLAPTAPPARRVWQCLTAAVGSGALLWMCYQPLAWGTYLGWVALVPFLLLVRMQARPSLVYLSAWLCGLVFYAPALQWLRVADYRMNATWALLTVYCAFYFPMAIYLIRRLERWRLPLIVSVPLVWGALEYVRSFLMTGFAWYLLAHTQHDVLPLIQITDLGGVFLVSCLVAAVNAFLFDCAYQFPEIRQWFKQEELQPYHHYASVELLNRSFFAELLFRRNLLIEGVMLALLLGGAYAYGEYRLHQTGFSDGPIVSLLQSNLDQRIREPAAGKDNNPETSVQTVQQHFNELCTRATRDFYPTTNLIVWPESSYPFPWVEVSTKLSPDQVNSKWRDAEIDMRENLAMLNNTWSKKPRIPHLIGMNAHYLSDQPAAGSERERHRHYNSAVLLNDQGKVDGRYDKMHRIPFGEFVPFKDWLPFMNKLAPYDFDFSVQRGEKFTRFQVKNHQGRAFDFGVLICYEDTDPFLARNYMDDSSEGPPVDFLVNISNDGWFDGSCEHEEHLVVSRFRAIECRRAMVRAVNMGISVLIDGNGRVLKPTPHPEGKPPVWVVRGEQGRFDDLPTSEWHTFKKVSGILTATVPIDHRFSFYALTGDWLPIGCWLVLLSSFAWSLLQSWRRSRSVSASKQLEPS